MFILSLKLQSTGQKDYIVHLAKTPPPLGKNVVEETMISTGANTQEDTAERYIKSVKDIPESWVADHAKYVRLLRSSWLLNTFDRN